MEGTEVGGDGGGARGGGAAAAPSRATGGGVHSSELLTAFESNVRVAVTTAVDTLLKEAKEAGASA
jgi:hypothetical protein